METQIAGIDLPAIGVFVGQKLPKTAPKKKNFG